MAFQTQIGAAGSRRATALGMFVLRLEGKARLTTAEREALLNLPGSIEIVAPHVQLRLPHKASDFCCLVADGFVGRTLHTSEGSRQITALSIAGEIPDLEAVGSRSTSFGLQSLSHAKIIHLPVEDLRRVLSEYPTLFEAFWREAVRDRAIAEQWVVNVGKRNALARVAHLLCELAVRYDAGSSANSQSFPLPLTQEQIGDALGLTSVHVNRTLMGLRTRGVLRIAHRSVRILDWNALVAAAGFDGAYLARSKHERLSAPGDFGATKAAARASRLAPQDTLFAAGRG